MPTNIEKRLHAALGALHPRYEDAKRLGPKALRYVRALLEARDEPLAPRAAYLAGSIGGAEGLELATLACRHRSPRVRIAAAQGARHLPRAEATRLLKWLLTDPDRDVVLTALHVAKRVRSRSLESPLRSIAEYHPDPSIRGVARATLG